MTIRYPRTSLFVHSVLAMWLALGLAAGSATAQPPVAPAAGPTPFPIDFEPFIRGDANADIALNIADAIRILAHLFANDAVACMDAADANDDDAVDIADAIFVVGHLFLATPAPPAPYPGCGADPTNDAQLGCQAFAPCIPTGTDRATAAHILRRIAYGPTPDELADLESIGAEAFILEQLDPLTIPEDPQVATKIAAVPISANYINYYRHVLLRGRYSTRQLLEQLTDFWSNHFNTYFWTVQGYLRNLDGGTIYDSTQSRVAAMELEAAEDAAFRSLALGSFEDLVLASATSPTMLIYLDNISNTFQSPNENYAREILELSTIGVTGGYTQNDVEQLARCFTGWRICKVDPLDLGDPHAPCLPNNSTTGVWSFHFDPATHDYGAKSLFPTTSYPLTIPARPAGSTDGVLDGYEVIAHLATTSQAAEYVSRKLIRKFVDDEAPPALLAACIGTWLSTDGDIGAVVETILLSTEFLGTGHRWNKMKTPMETLLSTVRIFAGQSTNANQERLALGNLQHLPTNFDTPDGYPELGDDWIGTAKIVDTIKFNELIYLGSTTLTYAPRPIQQAAGIDETDPDEVVGFWLELMFPGGTNAIDESIALSFYSTDDAGAPVAHTPGTAAYDLHLKKFMTFLRSWPQAMKQ